jgi:hypothetical protein
VPFAQYETSRTRRRLQQVAVPANIADRVTATGEKWLVDGSPIERQAALRAPYADAPFTSGQVDYPDAELSAILQEALHRDLPLMLHAVGDRAIESLLDQMDATGAECGRGAACALRTATGLSATWSRASGDPALSWPKIQAISSATWP